VSDLVLVDEAEERIRPLSIAANLAGWDVNVEATPVTEARLIGAELALSDGLADAGQYAALAAARGRHGDAATARRVGLLCDLLLPFQADDAVRRRIVELEASVESVFVAHRGVVGGREVSDNEITHILRASDDVVERREAWEASKTVGVRVAGDVRELARLRNEIARSLGHRDWFALSVSTSEMDEDRLVATLADVDRLTAEPFTRWKREVDGRLGRRFGCDEAELRPWHYADPFFQELPVAGGVDLDSVFSGRDVVALARRTFDGLGLETESVLARSDLFPRTRKSQHAFCLDVDREGDVRILCNVVPDAHWMETMLHELGHAVFSEGHDPRLPWLLRDCHLTTTEGVAIMAGRLVRDPGWLVGVAGLAESEARALASELRAAHAADFLLFSRWVLVMTTFERALYADPDRDLDTLWWELVRRYQQVTPPDGRTAPDWAAKIHLACVPVYYHTYLYGSITAAQLAAAVERDAGGLVDVPAAGALLRERVFRPGLSTRWDRLLEQATGERLAVRHFATEIEAGLAA
jgi:peptidyl-dipeptidase A